MTYLRYDLGSSRTDDAMMDRRCSEPNVQNQSNHSFCFQYHLKLVAVPETIHLGSQEVTTNEDLVKHHKYNFVLVDSLSSFIFPTRT